MCSIMGATMVQPCTSACGTGDDHKLGDRLGSCETRGVMIHEESSSQRNPNRRTLSSSEQHLEFENGGFSDESQSYCSPGNYSTRTENSSEFGIETRRTITSSRNGFHCRNADNNNHNATGGFDSSTKFGTYSYNDTHCSNGYRGVLVDKLSNIQDECELSYQRMCTSPERDKVYYRSGNENSPCGNYCSNPCTRETIYPNFKSLDSKASESSPRHLYQKHEGKVVIRPIAYRPAAPSPAQLAQGLSAPSGPIAGVGGRPPQDPRYNSTPALPRGTAPHYGSLGDLKSLGYSLDRRGLGTPLNHTAPSAGDPSSFSNPQGAGTGYLKHASLTHLHHVDHQPHSDIFIFHQNSSKNNGNSSSIYSNTNTGSLNHSCDSSNLNNTHTNCDSLVTSPRSLDNSNGDTSESPCDASPVRPPSQHKPPSGYSASTHDSPDSPPVCLLPSKQTHSHQIVYSSNSCPAGQGEPTSLQITNSPHNRTSQSNIQRYDNAKNYLPTTPPNHCDPTNNMTHSMVSSSNVPSSGHHQHHYHHLHHHHHRMGGSVSNLSRLSAAGIAGSNVALDRSASVTGANLGLTRSSVNGSMTELDDPSQQTPSPSDSGVAELEAILKEKDSEISLLKESMEQSEQIIFKVYEEKEKTWERELKKIRDMYEARLKASQQKITSLEQSLNSHAYQVQQERRKVSAEAAEARRERDAGRGQQQQLQQTIGSLRSQLEETEWGLCQKSGEISLLKSQLKDVQGDQTSRGHELLHLRAQLRQYAQEVERRRAEIASLHELTATLRKEAAELRAAQLTSSGGVAAPADGDADQLRKVTQELMLLREERVRERERITEERSRWQQEKESVLRYQRQLQLACQHAQRTNRRLQHEMARLHGQETQPTSPTTPPPAVPPLPPGYNLPPSPLPPPPGVLSEEALC
ncbi:leucine zipper putative tumor suppressor 3 isoform X3 [Hyalella azteca]|uniref:Leucine zipper putative tumor suppressor 3 isoform X3 n=1 Tax=Hyalella azteca TaxID=294128 RepID=A0A8B7P9E4_HYAAZ|nr:leucine zipper putative tumor suppressor 3 isoform X3 [Hyalella azteca]